MLIHLVSDLHMEFSPYIPHPKSYRADLIAVAGDIMSKGRGISKLRELWPNKNIVVVSGNHEHYGVDVNENTARMKENAKAHDILLLETETVVIDGVRIFGCTLWTDFMLYGKDKRKFCLYAAQQSLNDFKYIRTKDGSARFTALDSIEIHQESLKHLKQTIDTPFDGPTVILTHHAPSYKSVVPRFQNDLLSACFASNLDDLMCVDKVELWMHGHMHDSLDYKVNGTRVICNPRGYTSFNSGNENGAFDPGLLIEVKKGKAHAIKH